MLTNRVFVEIIRTFYYKTGFLQLNEMLFVAKRSAISYKMQCYLVLNAVLSRAKRKTKSCFLQIFRALLATRMIKKQAAFSVKTNIKKAFLASKYSFCEDEKLPFSDHLEGLNGAKCRCNT